MRKACGDSWILAIDASVAKNLRPEAKARRERD